VVFTEFVVNAARRDSENAGRFRLIPARLLQRPLQQHFFAGVKKMGELPMIRVKRKRRSNLEFWDCLFGISHILSLPGELSQDFGWQIAERQRTCA
jgi:hypothetical protein